MKEKLDIVVIHVESNNITHRIFEDFSVNILADEMINIGKISSRTLKLVFPIESWRSTSAKFGPGK